MLAREGHDAYPGVFVAQHPITLCLPVTLIGYASCDGYGAN